MRPKAKSKLFFIFSLKKSFFIEDKGKNNINFCFNRELSLKLY